MRIVLAEDCTAGAHAGPAHLFGPLAGGKCAARLTCDRGWMIMWAEDQACMQLSAQALRSKRMYCHILVTLICMRMHQDLSQALCCHGWVAGKSTHLKVNLPVRIVVKGHVPERVGVDDNEVNGACGLAHYLHWHTLTISFR